MTARPGDTLHRYRLDECVGVGGMAQVFRATALGAEGFEKAVAIKRILPSLAGEGFQRRFVNEAKLSAQLTHPNIVQIIDFGRADGSLYIAMEYVDGVDLLALLRRPEKDGLVPVAAALYIALATCRGLAFAHASGVIHRDVSPSNILLSVSGAVKVADFGIAYTVDAQTGPRQIIGKLCYMSPEQTRGDPLDARTDVFSAGIVFHELFTSRRLFIGGDFEEVRTAIAEQAIPSVREVRPDCPVGLDRILQRMLARDREQRYARFRDIEKDLMELCLGHSIMPSESDVSDVVSAAKGVAAIDRDAAVRALLARAAGGVGPRRATEAGTEPPLPIEDLTGATLMIRNAHGKGDREADEWALEPAGASLTSATTSVTHAEPSTAVEQPAPGRRRPVRRAVIAAGLAIAAGAFGSRALMDHGGETPPRASEPAAAPRTTVLTPPSPAPPVEPAPDAAAAMLDAGAVTEARPTTATTPAPVRQTPPRAISMVQISAVPWAHVYLGSRKLGTSPSQRRFRLPHGTHVLTLTNPELGRTRRVKVTVPSDEVYRFDLRTGD